MSGHSVRCAAILAGGQSSRMGLEKALLQVEGQALIARVAEVLKPIFPDVVVITAKPEVAQAANLASIPDQFPDSGPLGGIHAALQHFEAPTFIVACDMPFLNGDYIRTLGQNFEDKTLVPLGEEGPEPLHAIYAPANALIFERILKTGGKIPSLRRVLHELEHRTLPLEVARNFDPDLRMFANWNTPDDMEAASFGKL